MTVVTLETKNIYFKNHSYVITYLLAKEFIAVNNGGGWFDVIKDVSIHLENKNDKKALKETKRVIKEIWKLLFEQGEVLEEISSNIYTLKRTK